MAKSPKQKQEVEPQKEAEAPAPVEAVAAPLVEIPEDPDQKRINDFMAEVVRLRTQREQDELPKPPPAPTARQLAQIEAEKEAGRRASERHAAQAAHRPAPVPDPSENTVAVFRPSDYVHENKVGGK
jgi:hypothetical protein